MAELGPDGDLEHRADSSFRNVAPVHVQVSSLSLAYGNAPSIWQAPLEALKPVPKRQARSPKQVLDSVSVTAQAGSLTAILGASGSGKTTLLNTISERVTTSKLSRSGTITYNGSENLQTVSSAYVMQQDVLLPTLTVRETLQYAAELRLPPPATRPERRAAVERVIRELGLGDCADTRIGGSSRKGCSGGEKRRTTIGVQMLANPSVLFCDEPTTGGVWSFTADIGLDAYSAFQVVKRLKRLAEGGRTVIMSIHAPRSEIWSLFDNVVLLSKGSALYSGPASNAVSYFRNQGHEMGAFVNPSEFLIDLAAVDNRSEELEATSSARVGALKGAWTLHESTVEKAPSLETSPSRAITRQNVGFGRQLAILVHRTIKVTVRDPMGLLAMLFEAFAMSIVAGWIFLQLGEDLSGIRGRQGAVYTAASLQGYLVLLFETYRLTHDIQVFDREHKEGVVSVPAFLLSRRIARFPLEDFPVPLIFSLIFYWMAGFRTDAAAFFVFYAYMVISHYISITLAMVCVAVSRGFAGASLVANLNFTLQALACGFFVQVDQIPVYTRWTKWITYNFYLVSGLCGNEFVGFGSGDVGQFYACPAGDPNDPSCLQYRGTFIMTSLGFPRNWIWRPLVISFSFVVLFGLLSWLILEIKKVEISIVQPRRAKEVLAKEKIDASALSEELGVDIDLVEYALEVRMRNLTKVVRKPILYPVNTSFERGKINIIMGPSGSGKTSLLQSLAQRLRNTATTTYQPSGTILVNGAKPSTNVMRSIASFVTQDDDALMAELTVRETLRFAAELRLPRSMTRAQKLQRAEDVLLAMGLKDCANLPIGSDLKKGISGGEKRRVSIAVQILTDPKVLLLDEPTSGLDAFTASSIMDVLVALASEGRTIIMTIHQARSDMFDLFDNVLLLARGGSLVYSGAGRNMLDHFASIGYECPENSNPADYVLDIVTVALQEDAEESQGRDKVGHIIKAWREKDIDNTPRRPQSAAATAEELQALTHQMNPFYITFPLITRRSALQIMRNPDILMARTMQVIGFGGIVAIFFAPLQDNFAAIQSRMGFIQEFAALYFIAARTLFYREHDDNCYGILTFMISYTLLEIPFTAIASILYGVLVFGIGLKRTAGYTFLSALGTFCIVSCGESLGIMFITATGGHDGFSVQLMSIVLSIGNIIAGVLSPNMPAFFEAWNYISPCKYVVGGLAAFGMAGQPFTCSDAEKVSGVCPISTGEQVLELYDLDVNGTVYMCALVACAVVYRVLAVVVLWLARTHWDGAWLSDGKSSRKLAALSRWRRRVPAGHGAAAATDGPEVAVDGGGPGKI